MDARSTSLTVGSPFGGSAPSTRNFRSWRLVGGLCSHRGHADLLGTGVRTFPGEWTLGVTVVVVVVGVLGQSSVGGFPRYTVHLEVYTVTSLCCSSAHGGSWTVAG